MNDAPIKVENLRKVFARKKEQRVAVADVSFTVGAGEIFGLLGPNGAGKSTTIRMLATLLEPSGGRISICGYDAARHPKEVRARLGCVLTGDRSVYWKLTAKENLEYFAALNHLPRQIAKERVAEVLERFALADRANDVVERFSTGMKQRLALARALLARPPVLLLDEPTVGLDPQSALKLRELIVELSREGHVILLTTHYMEEADQLCDRIGIIDHGRIIALDTPARLKASLQGISTLKVAVWGLDTARALAADGTQGALPTETPLLDAIRALPRVNEVAATSPEPDLLRLTVQCHEHSELLPALIDTLTARGGSIRQVEVHEPSLEDVFLSLTGKRLRE